VAREGTGWATVRNIGMVLGILVAAGSMGSGIVGLGARFAAADFATQAQIKEREAALRAEIVAIIAANERLATQREGALAQRIEELGRTTKEANDRLTNSIDRIYNLLLQGRR
jgi:4-aminobutyrate aminotransferase-like enzyme